MRTWATVLGNNDVAALLEETLEEEKEADMRLTGIAESYVNAEAARGDGGGTETARRGMRASRAVSGTRRQVAGSRREAQVAF
jgi:Domain of unknown function (DUF892)